MDKELEEYINIIRKDIKKALKDDDFDELFDLLGFIKEGSLDGLSKEEINAKKADAFFRLGKLYDQQDAKQEELAKLFGFEKDYKKAITFYTKAVTMGDQFALSSLYSLYLKIQDNKKAEDLLMLGVKIKQPKCLYILGLRYFRNSEYKKALPYFIDAYNQAPQFGGYELGRMYEEGLGVEVDMDQAFYYFLDAADCGDKMAMHKVGLLYRDLGQDESAKYYLNESINEGIIGEKKEDALRIIKRIDEETGRV